LLTNVGALSLGRVSNCPISFVSVGCGGLLLSADRLVDVLRMDHGMRLFRNRSFGQDVPGQWVGRS
jgi:hypothetical protein